ncbi:MAG: gamma-glutamyltranspeptidase [marine bacterium B5-7]|nr:MAG: gamma-glutamyltranspeptidase [marine bacterium B5-7]
MIYTPLRTTVFITALLLSVQASQSATTDTESVAPEQGFGVMDKPAIFANRFMIVAAHPDAAKAGYEVLVKGGSAVDAAVATQMVLNLVEPQSSGLGGGAFLVYYDNASRTLHTFDGRETAPASIQADRFLDTDGNPLPWWQRITGGGSVGVPGTLKLLEVVHQRFGTLPFDSLLEPAIHMASEGFTVSPRMSASIADASDKGLMDFATTRDYFLDAAGEPLAAGSRQTNPEFANTLQLIARHGSSVFYEGEIAEDIVATINASRADSISLDDLANYRVIERPAVCAAFRTYRVCGMGPPSSGALTVGQILGILNHRAPSENGPDSRFIHRFAEAGKLAYADRAMYIADSDFVPVPVTGLLDPDYLGQRAALIDDHAAMPEATAGQPPSLNTLTAFQPDNHRDLPGTSHISIIDESGNIVSMTTTIESGFGSRLMTHGFLLNNELTDFAAIASEDGELKANRIEPGKRPRSSMAPSIVLDAAGQPVLIAGSPGGSRIINYVAKTLALILDFDMSPQQAVSLPHFGNRNGATELEEGPFLDNVANDLTALGHQVKRSNMNSGLHVIRIHADGRLEGGADPRREGVALGE